MTIRQLRLGSLENILQYDDADYDTAIETDRPIRAGAPVNLSDVARLSDLSGLGDVLGPAASGDEAVARFDGINVKKIQDSGLIIDDGGDAWWNASGNGWVFGSCGGDDIAWSQAAAVQNTWYLISDATIADGQLNLVTHDGNGKLTVTKAGKYLINWSGAFESNIITGSVHVGLSINGASPAAHVGLTNRSVLYGAAAPSIFSGTGIVLLAANDTVELTIRTTAADTPNLSCHFYMLSALIVGR
jgi:hypothetical protein